MLGDPHHPVDIWTDDDEPKALVLAFVENGQLTLWRGPATVYARAVVRAVQSAWDHGVYHSIASVHWTDIETGEERSARKSPRMVSTRAYASMLEAMGCKVLGL